MLVARCDERRETLRSLRGLASMRYESAEERVQVSEVVVVERPDRLRLEMISTFGVALQITSDGERVRAFHRADRTFYEGRATARNLSRFTRLALGIDEIADVLAGLPPGRPRRGEPEAAWEPETGLWRLAATLQTGGRQLLWFDGEALLPVRGEEVDSRGERRYLIAFGDYRAVDGFAFPHVISVEIPAEEARIVLTYSEIELNAALRDALFSFDPPPGARIVDLDEMG